MKLEDIELAKKTPYVYLTTEGAAHVFEIFAVFYCEAETSPVPYHMAEYSDERFNALIGDVKARSEYAYDVEVTPEDQVHLPFDLQLQIRHLYPEPRPALRRDGTACAGGGGLPRDGESRQE